MALQISTPVFHISHSKDKVLQTGNIVNCTAAWGRILLADLTLCWCKCCRLTKKQYIFIFKMKMLKENYHPLAFKTDRGVVRCTYRTHLAAITYLKPQRATDLCRSPFRFLLLFCSSSTAPPQTRNYLHWSEYSKSFVSFRSVCLCLATGKQGNFTGYYL